MLLKTRMATIFSLLLARWMDEMIPKYFSNNHEFALHWLLSGYADFGHKIVEL